MESLAKFNQHPLNVSSNNRNHLLQFTKPISSISLKTLSKSNKTLVASFSSNKNPQFDKTPKNPFSLIIKTTCVTIFTTSLFLNQFTKPSIAAPIPQETFESIEETEEEIKIAQGEEEEEKPIDEKQQAIDSLPNDVESLKLLMENKIKDKKVVEAVTILDKLIEIDPSDPQWPLLKSHLQSSIGEAEAATLGFEEILSKDPLSVEAYHGLVMAASQSETGELQNVLKRIENAMEKCKKEKNKKEDVRDFRLLIAQVRVIEGNYDQALSVYQELVKEEPRDFRPYLCQGIIYTLLRKTEEAAKSFEKYQKLVPKDHPYHRYFEDNMMATKVFSQMAGSQTS
ncbi:protein SLOW GREEN 1, chloroplastic-like [Papaver somniferum]|uniref:protein SLOW GREEN 1, chloroplastic-like n=1 Tax=Papaver somniferum TaxID=3469 RepID=UPI000E6F67E0|nr:protein SLOW GREEN 1, chloroplastic-like [Papaver somniferum]